MKISSSSPISLPGLVKLNGPQKTSKSWLRPGRTLSFVIAIVVSMGASTGCSVSLSGPDPVRRARAVPRCDTGKGMIWLDAFFGTLVGGLGMSALVATEGESFSYVPLGIGSLYLITALTANSRVNECRSSFEKYDREMTALLPPQSAPVVNVGAPATTGGATSTTGGAPHPISPAARAPELAAAPAIPAVMQVSDRDIIELAKRYVAEGLAAQRAGQFQEAIGLYNRAYNLAPHSKILFNLGQAYRLGGNKRIALDYYRKYLAIGDDLDLLQESNTWADLLDNELVNPEAARQAEEATPAK